MSVKCKRQGLKETDAPQRSDSLRPASEESGGPAEGAGGWKRDKKTGTHVLQLVIANLQVVSDLRLGGC